MVPWTNRRSGLYRRMLYICRLPGDRPFTGWEIKFGPLFLRDDFDQNRHADNNRPRFMTMISCTGLTRWNLDTISNSERGPMTPVRIPGRPLCANQSGLSVRPRPRLQQGQGARRGIRPAVAFKLLVRCPIFN